MTPPGRRSVSPTWFSCRCGAGHQRGAALHKPDEFAAASGAFGANTPYKQVAKCLSNRPRTRRIGSVGWSPLPGRRVTRRAGRGFVTGGFKMNGTGRNSTSLWDKKRVMGVAYGHPFVRLRGGRYGPPCSRCSLRVPLSVGNFHYPNGR
jgi:hypothetical protein